MTGIAMMNKMLRPSGPPPKRLRDIVQLLLDNCGFYYSAIEDVDHTGYDGEQLKAALVEACKHESSGRPADTEIAALLRRLAITSDHYAAHLRGERYLRWAQEALDGATFARSMADKLQPTQEES